MQDHTQKKRSRKAKLLGGALVGTVLSLGVMADSASAWTRLSSTTATTGTTTTVTVGDAPAAMMSSGIRW